MVVFLVRGRDISPRAKNPDQRPTSNDQRKALEMTFKFEQLEVWKDSIKYANEISRLVLKFPKFEQFALANQMRNSAISISSNIAEGCGRFHNKDFIRFLRIALGSTYEAVSQLYIAREGAYLTQEKFDELYEEGAKISNKLNALINKIK